jgi:redox-sensitive bicupin YhaK (pirin superfamily)
MAELIILQPRLREVGGGTVRRALPATERRSVGPFVFFDHFGPEQLAPFELRDVRPHPHIGLSTVTYLLEGSIVHRDSLGTVQTIEPGAINWMTAGRGIAHSERTPVALASQPRRTHGLQLWVGLPRAEEERAPIFAHTAASVIPSFDRDRARLRLLVGRAWGVESPVATSSAILYVDIALGENGSLDIPPLATERALYGLDAPYEIDGRAVEPFAMAVLPSGTTARVTSKAAARLVLIGGEPLDGPRFIWWNFVSSRKELIVAAAEQWAKDHSPQVPGEKEWIDPPDRPTFRE